MSTLSSVAGSAAAGPLTGLNSSGISFNGLASGLDTNSIIQGLLSVQQSQVTLLKNQQTKVVQQQTAFKSIEAKLLDLQTQAGRLGQALGSVLDSKTVTSSDPTLVTAAATASAAPGIYSFTVNNLAQAQQVASQGLASASSTITQGTLQLRVGSGATTTLTIDGTNNTLQGLAGAINSSGGDVTAAVVNDGTSGTPYRLLLTAKKSGAANAVAITNNLAADGGGAVKPLLTTTVQAATDASLTLGAGAGALTVTSPTNEVNGVIDGVTLKLLGANGTKPITLTVANDVATAQTAVHDFVASYNGLTDFINTSSTYDPQTQQAGVLLGNQQAGGIEDTLSRTLSDVVAGVNSQANRLSAIGVTLDDTGKLQIDDTKLGKALSGQVSGTGPGDVTRLFALAGVSTNPGVQFIAAGDKTQASATPYQVNVTQAATQAVVSATNALAPAVVIDGTNNTLSLTVDGRASSTITLAQGTYTAASLAQELQGEVNADPQIGNGRVLVSVDGNHLKLTSQSFGGSSQVKLGTGTALTALGFTGTESATGQNVAGNFVVNGVVEAASGTGQFLTGLATNAHTASLEVRVTLNASQLGAAPQAGLTVTRGLASKLGQVLAGYLDPVTGRLASLDQSFQQNVNDLQKSIDLQNAQLQNRQQQLLLQFAALEATVSQLKAAGNYLGSLSLAAGSFLTNQTSGSPSVNASAAGS